MFCNERPCGPEYTQNVDMLRLAYVLFPDTIFSDISKGFRWRMCLMGRKSKLHPYPGDQDSIIRVGFDYNITNNACNDDHYIL